MLPATTVTVLVSKAPHLSELLPTDAQKALSATRREVIETFTSQVQVVTAFCNKDNDAVVRHSWPMLNMVIMKHESDGCIKSPTLGAAHIEFNHSDPCGHGGKRFMRTQKALTY